MVDITDNVITIVRGDTFETQISIKTRDGQEYIPWNDDTIRFALKSDYSDGSPVLIRKEIDPEEMVLRLEACETKQLPARKRPYVYDIELSTADGYVDTFIRSQMRVLEEVD